MRSAAKYGDFRAYPRLIRAYGWPVGFTNVGNTAPIRFAASQSVAGVVGIRIGMAGPQTKAEVDRAVSGRDRDLITDALNYLVVTVTVVRDVPRYRIAWLVDTEEHRTPTDYKPTWTPTDNARPKSYNMAPRHVHASTPHRQSVS